MCTDSYSEAHILHPQARVDPSSWILTDTLTQLDPQSAMEVTVWCASPRPQI